MRISVRSRLKFRPKIVLRPYTEETAAVHYANVLPNEVFTSVHASRSSSQLVVVVVEYERTLNGLALTAAAAAPLFRV